MQDEVGLNLEPKTDDEAVVMFGEIRKISDDFLSGTVRKWMRWLALYHNRLNLRGRDPYKIYPKIGKEFSILQTYLASTVRTMFGSTPYFPIEARRKEMGWNKAVEVIQKVMDFEAQEFSHFLPLVVGSLHTHLLGNGFYENRWKLQARPVKYKVPKRANGYTIGYDTVTDWMFDEGLRLRAIAPWMCRWDPIADEPRNMRWFYKMEVVSRTQLKAQMGKAYERKFDSLKSPSAYGPTGKKMLELVNYSPSIKDKDLCVIVCLWLPFSYRYIELVDGESVIRDEVAEDPSQYRIGVMPMINNPDPMTNTLLGVSDMQVIEQQSALIELSLGQELNATQQRIDNMFVYNADVFPDPNMLIGPRSARLGVRVSELASKQASWDQLIQEIKTQPQTNYEYKVRQDLMQILDDSIGQDATSRGTTSTDDRTATEVATRVERHDRRQAMKMKLMELTGFQGLAINSYSMLMRYASDRMKREILGQDARYWSFDALEEVPGGVQLKFLSSLMMAGYEAKRRGRLEDFQMLGAFVNQREAAAIHIEHSLDYTEEERERLLTLDQPQAVPGMPGAGGGAAAPGGGLGAAEMAITAAA